MAARRTSISNPLALAVLACLHERPMHPYEMASTMRERGKEQSIKLNYGSLYTVVDSLAKNGLIEAAAARREGAGPSAPCTASPRPAGPGSTPGCRN